MKKYLVLAAVLIPLPAFAVLEQKSPPVRSTDEPLLVWDLDPSITNGFRNFRTSNDPLKPKADGSLPSAAGLPGLHESGSSEFSSEGFKAMRARFSGPITVFDLRQEDHGFINGAPISWFATNNWANVGKTHSTVVTEEKDRLAGLSAGTEITISDDKAKKGTGPSSVSKPETIALAETEQQLITGAGASYVRITVSDHCRPTDEEVDRFVAAVRQLPADAWAHFHCRAGRGRTTTFMALYDMLRNAREVPLLDIDQRQSLLAGDYDLLGKEGEPGARAAAADRAAFVRAFYDYAKANPNGQPQLWTEWLKSQP